MSPLMKLVVGRRPVTLPSRPCQVEDVRRAVERINPPFVVRPKCGDQGFAVRRRIFLEGGGGLRVECEGEGELRLACKLLAEDHNLWQTLDDTRACVLETERMERELMEEQEEDHHSDGGAVEEEDITLTEWEQMGYKWFRKEDVVYI